MVTTSELQDKIAIAKARYRDLLKQSQNPHADPVLKSLEMAIAKLEKQAKSAK
ncbi:hypothetical protein [Synechococcus sp. PCC 7336]|uniref:hypothetical protein n=1 Tax=Synechococcus sp. PCC 7336 TaxID=195250 RepID=UPI00034D7F7E|nr:hypothetical protein [Synechococcus sp. PCC 7336]